MTYLGPEKGYIDLMDEALLAYVNPKKYNPLRPSSAGKCERQLGYDYLEFLGIREFKHKPQEPNQKRLLDFGSSVEYHVLKHFSKVPDLELIYKQQQLLITQLKDGSWITGSTDMALFIKEHKCLADVKSKKDKWSNYYTNKWAEHNTLFSEMKTVKTINKQFYYIDDLIAFLDELYRADAFEAPWLEANFLQLNLYANNDFFVKQGVDHCAVIQYNKNDSLMRELRFRPSKEAADYVIEKFHNIHNVVTETKDVELLKRDYNLGSGPCAFCDYASVCRPDENTLKEHFKTYPKKSWPTHTDKLDQEGQFIEQQHQYVKEGTKLNKTIIQAEQRILKVMEDRNLWKVELKDGTVYDRKTYKSPKPHVKLVRSKK